MRRLIKSMNKKVFKFSEPYHPIDTKAVEKHRTIARKLAPININRIDRLNIITLNMHGCDAAKFEALCEYLSQYDVDIAFLQETKAETNGRSKKDARRLHPVKSTMSYKVFRNDHTQLTRNGVAIMIKRSRLTKEVALINADVEGRSIVIDYFDEHIQSTIRVASLYFPNSVNDRIDFINELNWTDSGLGNAIIGTDSNLKLKLIEYSYPKDGDKIEKDAYKLMEVMHENNLMDAYDVLTPHERTMTRWPLGRQATSQRATCIDRFLINTALQNSVQYCGVTHHTPFSDHWVVTLKLGKAISPLTSISEARPPKPPTWILSVGNNLEKADEIASKAIRTANQNGKTAGEALIDAELAVIQFAKDARTNTKTAKRQSVKRNIQRQIRKYNKELQDQTISIERRKDREKLILKERSKLYRLYKLAELSFKNYEDNIRFEQNAPIMTSKANKTKTVFTSLKPDPSSAATNNPIEMANITRAYMQSILNAARDINDEGIAQLMNEVLDSIPHSDEAKLFDFDIGIANLKEAINCSKNSAPGPNGVDKTICKIPSIQLQIVKTWEKRNQEDVPKIWSESHICLFHKSQKDPQLVKSYRPISLLCYEYRLIMKAIQKRWSDLLPKIVSEEQDFSIQDRDQIDNITTIMGVINDANENSDKQLAILFLDFVKAYDNICRTFVLRALSKIGFNKQCVDDIEKFVFKNNTAKIVFNGRLLEPINITNGVPQGSAMSCVLYSIASSTLTHFLKRRGVTGYSPSIEPDKRLYGKYFCDNITLFASSTEQCDCIIKALESFGVATNQKHDIKEIRALRINNIILPKTAGLRHYAMLNDGAQWTPELKDGFTDGEFKPIKHLGFYFNVNGSISNKTFDTQLKKMEERVFLIKQRKDRYSKAIAFATLIEPLFHYLARAIVLPDYVTKAVNNTFRKHVLINDRNNSGTTSQAISWCRASQPSKYGGLLKNGGLYLPTDAIAFHAMLYARHLERQTRGRGASNDWLLKDVVKNASYSLFNAMDLFDAYLGRCDRTTYNPFMTSMGAFYLCKPYNIKDSLDHWTPDRILQIDFKHEKSMTLAPLPKENDTEKERQFLYEFYDSNGNRLRTKPTEAEKKFYDYIDEVNTHWPILDTLRDKNRSPDELLSTFAGRVKYANGKGKRRTMSIVEYLYVRESVQIISEDHQQKIIVKAVKVPIEIKIDSEIKVPEPILRAKCEAIAESEFIEYDPAELCVLIIDTEGILRLRADADKDPCLMAFPIDDPLLAISINSLCATAAKNLKSHAKDVKETILGFVRADFEQHNKLIKDIYRNNPSFLQLIDERKYVQVPKLKTKHLRKRMRELYIEDDNIRHFQSHFTFSFEDMMKSRLSLPERDHAWLTLHNHLAFGDHGNLKQCPHCKLDNPQNSHITINCTEALNVTLKLTHYFRAIIVDQETADWTKSLFVQACSNKLQPNEDDPRTIAAINLAWIMKRILWNRYTTKTKGTQRARDAVLKKTIQNVADECIEEFRKRVRADRRKRPRTRATRWTQALVGRV